ncbi:MAG TPA: aminotransferase class V-fold PLP-dependent enzyme [Flavilitoribacter sp.]|nr:aminotransferase class V-fold PLP-dependent enzyme [Flavilitoribacter sp.]HMQ88972.1 aminotransferase class V-fold PLP-dependent enzyme [Flavilitoribacter sp.]
MKSAILRSAYDPEAFRRNGHELVDLLADYLSALESENEIPANAWIPPQDSLEFWERELNAASGNTPVQFFGKVMARSVHLHHPRYMGHQISPPAPVAALAGFLGDFLNNGMGVYEMGVSGTPIEHIVIKTVAGELGFDERSGGYLTSGGSLANLTALLAARSIKSTEPVWETGNGRGLALMVSEEAHYCVDRAARIMGWGAKGIIKIPVNDRFQMRTELLPQYLEKARRDDLTVLAVVGSACSTSTGAFDDLESIGQFCRDNGLWFHVDGAHGAALGLSPAYRSVVKGLNQADSVAMDFHKMLMTPSVTTALIFKDGLNSFRTFNQQAQYLFDRAEEGEWYNLAKRTFECTKLMLGLKVYAILQSHGMAFFADCVTRLCDLGKAFANLIRETSDFELAVEPACNIVCFRYKPPGWSGDPDYLNEGLRKALLLDGTYYVVQTRLKNHSWIRCTLSNPFTTETELTGLLRKIRTLAADQGISF